MLQCSHYYTCKTPLYKSLEFETQYSVTNIARHGEGRDRWKIDWSYARGFALAYYIDEKSNVEFRYFPDVAQASLYIRDKNQCIELIEKMHLPEGKNHHHHVTIKEGCINWWINGKLVFNNQQTSQSCGKIRLTSHNNQSTFKFKN